MEVINGGAGKAQVAQNVQEQIPAIFQQMNEVIQDCDEYAWNRGVNGGLDWGMPIFNEVFSGLNTGLHIVGGQPNTGKSTLCLQMAWNIAKNNQTISKERPNKAYVLYIALDDTSRDILPRIVAHEAKLEIDIVQKPQKYAHADGGTHLLTRRKEGFKLLKQNLPYFKMIDQAHEQGCEYIETIQTVIQKHINALQEISPNYKLVVFIDNLHDIDILEGGYRGDENGKMIYIVTQLSNMCNVFDIPMICTAEFRKLNGNHRPSYDDIKESGKIGYSTKAIMLCYNEHGLKGEAANIYWLDAAKQKKQPVLEVRIAKNKLSSNKDTLYFKFIPEMATCEPSDPDAVRQYIAMMRG